MPDCRLNVLVLSPHPDVQGGVSTFIETMKAHLTKTNVLSFWIGNRQNGKEHFLHTLKRIVTTPFQIAWKVHALHADIVHINPSLTMKSTLRDMLILLALRLSGFKRTLVYFHGWQFKVERLIAGKEILGSPFAWLLNGAGHIMVLAPEFKDALVKMGVNPASITVTRTMFDGRGLHKTSPSAGRRNILYMSRFVAKKGVYELIDAFARIADRFPDVDLIFAGGGEEESGMRERVKTHNLETRIFFPGYVLGEEKIRLLNACTVFALPTYLTEGMPVALLEAMAAGKPLLTAGAGAIPYIACDPENGVVLEHVTVDSVEAAVIALLGNTSYCETVGAHNRAYAWNTFEAGIVTAEIEAAYLQLAGMP